MRCVHLDRHKAVIAPESSADFGLPDGELPVHAHWAATGEWIASFW